MTELFGFLDKFNWQTILGMFVIGWYFTKDIRISLQNIDKDVREQGKRIDRLYEMFIELLKDTRK